MSAVADMLRSSISSQGQASAGNGARASHHQQGSSRPPAGHHTVQAAEAALVAAIQWRLASGRSAAAAAAILRNPAPPRPQPLLPEPPAELPPSPALSAAWVPTPSPGDSCLVVPSLPTDDSCHSRPSPQQRGDRCRPLPPQLPGHERQLCHSAGVQAGEGTVVSTDSEPVLGRGAAAGGLLAEESPAGPAVEGRSSAVNMVDCRHERKGLGQRAVEEVERQVAQAASGDGDDGLALEAMFPPGECPIAGAFRSAPLPVSPGQPAQPQAARPPDSEEPVPKSQPATLPLYIVGGAEPELVSDFPGAFIGDGCRGGVGDGGAGGCSGLQGPDMSGGARRADGQGADAAAEAGPVAAVEAHCSTHDSCRNADGSCGDTYGSFAVPHTDDGTYSFAAQVISAMPQLPPGCRQPQQRPQPRATNAEEGGDGYFSTLATAGAQKAGKPPASDSAGGGDDGGGKVNGGSDAGSRKPPVACSRAVGRYGALLMSSAGWRCTEMYDMHDSLLLSRLAGRTSARSLYHHPQQQLQQGRPRGSLDAGLAEVLKGTNGGVSDRQLVGSYDEGAVLPAQAGAAFCRLSANTALPPTSGGRASEQHQHQPPETTQPASPQPPRLRWQLPEQRPQQPPPKQRRRAGARQYLFLGREQPHLRAHGPAYITGQLELDGSGHASASADAANCIADGGSVNDTADPDSVSGGGGGTGRNGSGAGFSGRLLSAVLQGPRAWGSVRTSLPDRSAVRAMSYQDVAGCEEVASPPRPHLDQQSSRQDPPQTHTAQPQPVPQSPRRGSLSLVQRLKKSIVSALYAAPAEGGGGDSSSSGRGWGATLDELRGTVVQRPVYLAAPAAAAAAVGGATSAASAAGAGADAGSLVERGRGVAKSLKRWVGSAQGAGSGTGELLGSMAGITVTGPTSSDQLSTGQLSSDRFFIRDPFHRSSTPRGVPGCHHPGNLGTPGSAATAFAMDAPGAPAASPAGAALPTADAGEATTAATPPCSASEPLGRRASSPGDVCVSSRDRVGAVVQGGTIAGCSAACSSNGGPSAPPEQPQDELVVQPIGPGDLTVGGADSFTAVASNAQSSIPDYAISSAELVVAGATVAPGPAGSPTATLVLAPPFSASNDFSSAPGGDGGCSDSHDVSASAALKGAAAAAAVTAFGAASTEGGVSARASGGAATNATSLGSVSVHGWLPSGCSRRGARGVTGSGLATGGGGGAPDPGLGDDAGDGGGGGADDGENCRVDHVTRVAPPLATGGAPRLSVEAAEAVAAQAAAEGDGGCQRPRASDAMPLCPGAGWSQPGAREEVAPSPVGCSARGKPRLWALLLRGLLGPCGPGGNADSVQFTCQGPGAVVAARAARAATEVEHGRFHQGNAGRRGPGSGTAATCTVTVEGEKQRAGGGGSVPSYMYPHALQPPPPPSPRAAQQHHLQQQERRRRAGSSEGSGGGGSSSDLRPGATALPANQHRWHTHAEERAARYERLKLIAPLAAAVLSP